MAARIVGVGKHLPSKVLTNADLERMVDTNDQWIVDRTGIRERRIAADDETTSSLGAEAVAHGPRDRRPRLPDDIDLVICATLSPDGMFPSSASLIQSGIGAKPRRRLRRQRRLQRLRRCPRDRRAVHQRRRLRARAGCGLRSHLPDHRLVRPLHLHPLRRWRRRGRAGEGRPGGVGGFVLRSDGDGADLLYARGPASAPNASSRPRASASSWTVARSSASPCARWKR